VLKRVYLGGEADLLLDVALIHEFGGNHMADVSRNGELRHTDPAMAMGWPHYWRPHQAPRGDRPHTVRCYREAYAARPGIAYAFLPRVMSTSGRIHSEFLRLLRTVRWFAQFGDDHPSDEAFKYRRGQYFWHAHALVDHASVRAVAQRAHVAEHTLHRSRAGPHTLDDLQYPLTSPVGL
jgi:hypothetical protein